MTNPKRTVLYTGVTNDLERRVLEHRLKFDKNSFTAKYNLVKLVYFEMTENSYEAINKEKQIKAGSRADKLNLIHSMNPNWTDLSESW